MKVISTCKCRVCSRSFRSLNRSSSRSTVHAPASPTSAPSDPLSPRSSPIASTSETPYSSSLAVALPNELLLDIFRLARPTSVDEHRSWYAKLASVHSRWKDAAQDCLARVAVIRHEDQIAELDDALRSGTLGGPVEELVLNLRKTESGGTTTDHSLDAPLAKLLASTKDTLRVIRLDGFGINLISSMPATLARSLSAVETFAYSPIDSAFPLDSATLSTVLREMRSVKTVSIHPKSQSIGTLEDLGTSLVNPLLPRIIDALPVIAALERLVQHDYKYSKDLTELLAIFSNLRMIVDAQAAHLEQFSLSTLSFSPLLFLTLTINSLETLTSLSFTTIFIVGDAVAGYAEFFSLLSLLFAKQLREFTWNDPILAVIGIDHSLVPEEAFWDFLRRCVKLRRLSLLSPLVFAPLSRSTLEVPALSPPLGTTVNGLPPLPRPTKPSRARFALPPDLAHLSVGSIGRQVEEPELTFWLDHVENLVKGVTPRLDEPGNAAERVEGTAVEEEDADDFHDSLELLFTVPCTTYDRAATWMDPRCDGKPSAALESLSFSLPASSRSLLASRTVRKRIHQLRLAAQPQFEGEQVRQQAGKAKMGRRERGGGGGGGKAVSSENGLDRDDSIPAGTRRPFAIEFKFTCIVNLDELEMTRDLRLDM